MFNDLFISRLTHEQLEDALLLFHRAMDHLDEGITISDPYRTNNPIIYVNDAFLRLTGYEREDILGHNARLLQGADTDETVKNAVRTAIEKQHSITIDIVNYRKNGTPFWNNMTISPIRNEQGRLMHFVGIQRDVSHIKALEEENRRLKEAASVMRRQEQPATDPS